MSAKNRVSSAIESLVPRAALTLGLVVGLLIIPLATANAEIVGDPLAGFFASPCTAEQLEFSDSGVAALCALGVDTIAAGMSVQFSDSGVHGFLAARAVEIVAADVPPYTGVATFRAAEDAAEIVAADVPPYTGVATFHALEDAAAGLMK